jgi:hypothetical protein
LINGEDPVTFRPLKQAELEDFTEAYVELAGVALRLKPFPESYCDRCGTIGFDDHLDGCTMEPCEDLAGAARRRR